MSANGCIGVAEFGTVGGNSDSVDWLACKDVSYNTTTNQTTYKARDTITVIHNIQQRKRSQAFTRVYMVPEDEKCNRTGPNIEARCKTDTVHVQMLCQFLFLGGCVQ